MRLGVNIFVLIAFAELFSTSFAINCDRNKYDNNPLILPKLQGYFYTVYTSVPFSNNEIFHFGPVVKKNIFTRTTSDIKCCRTMNVSTALRQSGKSGKGSFYQYQITSDKGCAAKLDETAHLKLIAVNAEADGSYCIIVWTCRPTREGVHAFCTKNKVSARQSKWIGEQYKKLGLASLKVGQTTDYKNGKCFIKK